MPVQEAGTNPAGQAVEAQLEELKEYALCPLRHFYRFRRKEKGKLDETEVALFSLREALLWFYGQLRRRPVPLQDLFQKFDREMAEAWETAGLKGEIDPKLLALGRLRMKSHFDDGGPGTIVLGARVPFERTFIRLGTEYIIEGEIDLLRLRNDHQPQDRTFEIVQLYTGRRMPAAKERHRLIDLIGQRLGAANYGKFYKGKAAKTRVILHSLYQGQDFEVPLKEDELKSARGWIMDTAEALRLGLYYPQQDFNMCKQCPFRNRCDPGDPSRYAE